MSDNITHWLETAYSRICAGEAEANVLRDYGLIREKAFTIGVEHLRQENERLREENRLWYSRAVALFWRGDSDNITVGRLQLAAKEIDAALQEVPR